MLDTVSDAAGLRAVRAKVHAEASIVCPSCGRRHLLDSRCSAATAVVHEAETVAVESPVGAPAPETAVERGDTRVRRLLGSIITCLGLDQASFGDVDDGDARGRDVPPPSVGPHPRPMQRVIAFLGFDVEAPVRVDADEDDVEDVAVENVDVAPAAPTEEPRAPDDEVLGTDSPTDVHVHLTETSETASATASDDEPRRYWRRADDDILYRPSRRPRSPRRAWRGRTASRD